MTKRRIILIAAVIAVLVAAAAAGAYLYMNRFDAGEYVQAVLDVSYKNKTDKYVEITGVSEKEAEKIFEDNLDATMKGFETSDMPDPLKAGKVRPVFAEENARETDSGHGCPFASSCGYAMKCCFEGTPELYRFGSRETACFLYSEKYSGKRADGYRMTSQI